MLSTSASAWRLCAVASDYRSMDSWLLEHQIAQGEPLSIRHFMTKLIAPTSEPVEQITGEYGHSIKVIRDILQQMSQKGFA